MKKHDVSIEALELLCKKISLFSAFDEKLAFMAGLEPVLSYLSTNKVLQSYVESAPKEVQYVIFSVIALGQGPVIFDAIRQVSETKKALDALAGHLLSTEKFYDYMGGVIGYHLKTLMLIRGHEGKETISTHLTNEILAPVPYIDIRNYSEDIASMVFFGVTNLEQIAEVYVLGGAGERLHLKDEKTNIPLPVACLNFCGRSLLSGLIRDLEAREYLYYKLTGKRVFTPILLMTSHEKNNDAHIQGICEKEGYFGRPKESLFRIVQPLAPVLTVEGNWAVERPLELVLKPGGHGVIWKLAKDSGAFSWLAAKKRKAMVVRQINNPIAGLDYGLLALAGYGICHKKSFGFESCPRKENMSEGMNIARYIEVDGKTTCAISNIEYTEFAGRKKKNPHFGLQETLCDFPTNTNILYADIEAISEATKRCQIPGLLVNMKHPVETLCQGKKVTIAGARLESTMQNIADELADVVEGVVTADSLSTFVLLNDRAKTISVTKKVFNGKEILETPEGCFYDLITENLRMLKEECYFTVDQTQSIAEYIEKGPSALFLYHPALGPLYSIIGKKISRGRLAKGSELQIEAAEVYIQNLDVAGSLLLTAHNVTGSIDPHTGERTYNCHVGSFVLENVTVKNRGIDRCGNSSFWSNAITRIESCCITLAGHSECVAKNICIEGSFELTVPDGIRATLLQNDDGSIRVEYEPITTPFSTTPFFWKYQFDAFNHIQIELSN